MSTTIWLADHGWVQRCTDCDFYPCVCSEDDDEPNDCDEFCHNESEDE